MKTCSRCSEYKDLKDFYVAFIKKLAKNVYRAECKKCSKLLANERHGPYIPNHLLSDQKRKERLEIRNRYRRKHRAKNKQLGLPPISERERCTRNKRSFYLKKTILNHYGNFCACCGETEMDFLSVDHINNNAKEHATASGKRYSGHRLYATLIKLGYPSGIQILCFNCNPSKGHKGTCAHKLKTALLQGTQS